MSRVYYNKLVRDHIEQKIKDKGSHCEVRTLVDDAEFMQELLKKVHEEAGGLAMARSREEFLAEYVDLMVVLDALTQQFEISEADIKVAMTENISKKGLYKNRHFLHWSSDDDYKSNETPQGIQ
ncbi:MAG: hypothetical protein ACK42D_03450 [Candidatus Paceibacteria bacterium]